MQTSGSSRDTLFSTIGVSSGKYYAEFKLVAGESSSVRMDFGINGDPAEIVRSVVPIGNGATGYSFDTESAVKVTNGWMHIVFGYDSSQGTSSNRWKLYINGVQETSFSASMYPAQNANSRLNASGQAVRIGSRGDGNEAFDGSMSHFIL